MAAKNLPVNFQWNTQLFHQADVNPYPANTESDLLLPPV